MGALRLTTAEPTLRLANFATPSASGATKRVLSCEAYPTDVFETARIEPSTTLTVERLGHEGVEALSKRAMLPGRRVALVFAHSPFLPPPGTVTRVISCEPAGTAFRVVL